MVTLRNPCLKKWIRAASTIRCRSESSFWRRGHDLCARFISRSKCYHNSETNTVYLVSTDSTGSSHEKQFMRRNVVNGKLLASNQRIAVRDAPVRYVWQRLLTRSMTAAGS